MFHDITHYNSAHHSGKQNRPAIPRKKLLTTLTSKLFATLTRKEEKFSNFLSLRQNKMKTQAIGIPWWSSGL